MKHGIYMLRQTAVEQFESDWLNGQQVDLISTTYTEGFHDAIGISWEPGAGATAKRQSLQETFGNTNRTLLIAYEFAGVNRGDYGPPANGEFDAEYRNFARDLVSLGMGDSYIAPNHEFSLTWGAKSAYDEPENYRDGYARVVREMQSVDGADFTFCYAPSQNRIGVADTAWPLQSTYWPSGESAPIVTPSFYDAGNAWNNPSDLTDATGYPDDLYNYSETEKNQIREGVWQNKHLPTLQMWQDFADKRGAPMGFREWGCASDAWTNNGGLDNTMFIDRMFDWMEQNNWRFQTYWNGETQKHRIFPRSNSPLPDVGDAWNTRVLNDMSGSTDTSTDTSTDSGTVDTTHQYGGYATPEAGTLDWHVPLNENFTSIEEDIKSLEERIKQLESS